MQDVQLSSSGHFTVSERLEKDVEQHEKGYSDLFGL